LAPLSGTPALLPSAVFRPPREKNGPKLKESAPGAENSFSMTGKNRLIQITVTKGTMEQLALQLSSSVEHPVLDKTGLTGRPSGN
jgi:uncharacterized protein (TIGR03435 family)